MNHSHLLMSGININKHIVTLYTQIFFHWNDSTIFSHKQCILFCAERLRQVRNKKDSKQALSQQQGSNRSQNDNIQQQYTFPYFLIIRFFSPDTQAQTNQILRFQIVSTRTSSTNSSGDHFMKQIHGENKYLNWTLHCRMTNHGKMKQYLRRKIFKSDKLKFPHDSHKLRAVTYMSEYLQT